MKDKTWNKLLEYETRDLVERFIKTKHNRDASARQILEITSNFIQGREYFLNAHRAAMSVKPLLLYYGVSALARGLILAISPKLSESSMKPSHGLDTINWRESLSNKNFADLIVKIGNGTFFELLTATSNRTYFKHNSNGINWKVDFDIPKIGSEMRFEDLILTMSDLSDEYQTWKQNKLSYLDLETYNHLGDSDEREYVIHKGRNGHDEIVSIFPKSEFGEYFINEANNKVTIKTPSKDTPQFSQRFFDAFRLGMGEIVLTKSVNNNIRLNTLGQLYSLSFYLGMLSRYFPTVWISLARTEKGDAIYPLFIRAIEIVESYFPTTVIEFLNGPYEFEKNSS